ncbi:MAG: SPOR domain-containing protein, partial [Alistipes sp.]|nr:SPOR domain-containing protein [Alistipes sp.]
QESVTAEKTPVVEDAPIRYAIQIMASGSQLSLKSSAFKSYRGKVRMVRSSGRFAYKYCTGDYADKAAAQSALKSVRREFPQAFVIAVRNGRVVTSK